MPRPLSSSTTNTNNFPRIRWTLVHQFFCNGTFVNITFWCWFILTWITHNYMNFVQSFNEYFLSNFFFPFYATKLSQKWVIKRENGFQCFLFYYNSRCYLGKKSKLSHSLKWYYFYYFTLYCIYFYIIPSSHSNLFPPSRFLFLLAVQLFLENSIPPIIRRIMFFFHSSFTILYRALYLFIKGSHY